MTLFVKIAIGIVEHPKMLSVPKEHRWAFVELLCYCARNLTDGEVPEVVIPRLGITREEVASLVWAGLLDESGGLYQVHDYTDWQTRRELVQQRREAGRKGGLKSGTVRQTKQRSKSEASASFASKASASKSPSEQAQTKQTKPIEASASEANEPEVEVEVEVEVERGSKALARRAVEHDRTFDDFWSAYPRKAGKRTAQAAYVRALTRATAGRIFDGLQQQIPAWADPQFIPHPTTWLNRDGWLDDPAPTTGAATAPLHDLAAQVDRYEQGARFFA